MTLLPATVLAVSVSVAPDSVAIPPPLPPSAVLLETVTWSSVSFPSFSIAAPLGSPKGSPPGELPLVAVSPLSLFGLRARGSMHDRGRSCVLTQVASRLGAAASVACFAWTNARSDAPASM